jgi:hypothetical protein
MAPLQCELQLMNFAKRWDSFLKDKLLNTFNSKNISNNTKPAGNSTSNTRFALVEANALGTNSPEATCGNSFNFELFNRLRIERGLEPIDNDWLVWFIGFVEGDGAILVKDNNKYMDFVLTQREKDILEHIALVLQFGYVKAFPQNNSSNAFHRYFVKDVHSLTMLAYLFNGNLALTHRINQLSK